MWKKYGFVQVKFMPLLQTNMTNPLITQKHKENNGGMLRTW